MRAGRQRSSAVVYRQSALRRVVGVNDTLRVVANDLRRSGARTSAEWRLIAEKLEDVARRARGIAQDAGDYADEAARAEVGARHDQAAR